MAPAPSGQEVAAPEKGVGVEVHHRERAMQLLGARTQCSRGAVEGAVQAPSQDRGRQRRREEEEEEEGRAGDPEDGDHPGILIVPSVTKSAEPPTRTAAVVPSTRSASTSIKLGRPISRPCSTLQRRDPEGRPSTAER